MTEHRDAGWLAQLAEKDRQIQALQSLTETHERIRGENDQQIAELGQMLTNACAKIRQQREQIKALQAAYEDTRDSLQRALAALAEHDEAHRKRQAAAAYQYHQQANRP